VTQPGAIEPHAGLFAHSADIGVRGIGPTRESAFEQAALALSTAVTDPAGIAPRQAVEVTCEAPDDAFLLLDWLNALIYEMSVRRMVFGQFAVAIEGQRLRGQGWGEPADPPRPSASAATMYPPASSARQATRRTPGSSSITSILGAHS
jgi:SHS2 domain-containing protein